MILQHINADSYRKEFARKFESFAQTSPSLLSYVTDDTGVTILHENSGRSYKYSWDFTIPVKSFIHVIKSDLQKFHYPRLVSVVDTDIPLTSETAARLMGAGVKADELPKTEHIHKKKVFIIDKVLLMKDIAILLDEESGRTYKYVMKYPCVYFLRKYRTGEFKDAEEAGTFFFQHAQLSSELSSSHSQDS